MKAVVRPSKNPLEPLEIILILCPDKTKKSSRKSASNKKTTEIVKVKTSQKIDPLAFVEVLEDPLEKPNEGYLTKADTRIALKVPMEVVTEKPKNVNRDKRRQRKNDTETVKNLNSKVIDPSNKNLSSPKRSIIKFTADSEERSVIPLRKSVVKFKFSLKKNEENQNADSLQIPLTSRKFSVVPFKDTKIS